MYSVDARLRRLESRLRPDPVIIMVEDPEGNQEEMTVAEFAGTREARGLVFVRILRGFDPTYRDIEIILDSWECVAKMDRKER